MNDFNNLSKTVEKIAKSCFEHHKQSLENWGYGNISKIWFDNDSNICIEYETGKWFHYNSRGEWW